MLDEACSELIVHNSLDVFIICFDPFMCFLGAADVSVSRRLSCPLATVEKADFCCHCAAILGKRHAVVACWESADAGESQISLPV